MESAFKFGGDVMSCHVPPILFMLVASTAALTHFPYRMLREGGIAFFLIAAIFFFVLGVPLAHLQIAIGQYSKLGLFGLWRAFPIGRGIGVVWLFFSFVMICQQVSILSVNYKYLVPTLSTSDFPWLKCDQYWNTESCVSPVWNKSSSQPSYDLADADDRADNQYSKAQNSFDGSSVFALFLMWITVAAPIVLGPRSLFTGVFVSFIIVQACNTLLFFLAVSMPGAGSGMKAMFWPDFGRIDGNSLLDNAKMTHGVFQSAFGVLVFLGKHTQDHIFTLPHVFVAVFLSLVLSLINALKTAGFMGFYSQLCNLRDFYPTISIVPMATALSQAPGSNFWLLLCCIHDILKWSICCSIFSEIMLSAIVEVFPTRLLSRNHFPQSVILPAILTVVGFPFSIALLYVREADGWQMFVFIMTLNFSWLPFKRPNYSMQNSFKAL